MPKDLTISARHASAIAGKTIEEIRLPKEVLAALPRGLEVPAAVSDLGTDAVERFLEFFALTLKTKNTKLAYSQASKQFFRWCTEPPRRLRSVGDIRPLNAAAYVTHLVESKEELPTVKQHVSALRKLFDWLVTGHFIDTNPFTSVETPSYSVQDGKTPILTPEDTRRLLNSIDTTTLIGLRDKALIAMMIYTWARVSSVAALRVRSYYARGKRMRFRLGKTKGGKVVDVPAHPEVEECMDAYIRAAGLEDDPKGPLFRPGVGRNPTSLLRKKMSRRTVLSMIKRRAKAAGIDNWEEICCHTWRATGITVYLNNDGNLERAQKQAGHADSRTTKLYHREDAELELADILKIQI